MISTLIPKPCQDVVIGDQVVGHDGKLHRVSQVMTRPFGGELVVLRTHGALPVKFTPGHPILVYKRFKSPGYDVPAGVDLRAQQKRAYLADAFDENELRQPIWEAAENVEVGDYLMCPIPAWAKDATTPDPLPWISGPAQCRNIPKDCIDSDVAWLFGLYVADGAAEPGHRVQITLNKTEGDSVRRAVLAFSKLGVSARVKEFPTFYRVIVDSSIVANSFAEWFGTSSATKHLPTFLFKGWDLDAVLDGIFSGDGCDHHGAKLINTTSHMLALQLQLCLVGLGQRPSVVEAKRNGSEYSNAAPMYTIRWSPESKREVAMRRWKDWYLMPVTSASRERYDGTVWNYEIEDAHSYLTNNIIAHNCMEFRGRFIHPTKGKCVVVQNSWGDYFGRRLIVATQDAGDVELPEGCFAIRLNVADRMVREGDTFAISSLKGFPKRKPRDWITLREPVKGRWLEFPFALVP